MKETPNRGYDTSMMPEASFLKRSDAEGGISATLAGNKWEALPGEIFWETRLREVLDSHGCLIESQCQTHQGGRENM